MGSLTPECATHHDVAAATRCAHCGKPLCVNCIVNTKDDLEFCSAECLAAYTPQADTSTIAQMGVLHGPLKIERVVVGAGLCVFSVLSIVLGFLLLRTDFVLYGMVCLPLIYLVVRPVATTAMFLGFILVGQSVFVFYYYPLISGQVALSVVGVVIGGGLLYWAGLKWEEFCGPTQWEVSWWPLGAPRARKPAQPPDGSDAAGDPEGRKE